MSEEQTEKLFVVDAGTSKLGWAFFDDGVLTESGLVTDEGRPFERCESIARTVFYLVSSLQATRVVCEYPHKGGSGWKSGHITILFHLCGMLQFAMNHIAVPIEFILPMEWKGQVPKDKHQPKIIKKAMTKYGMDIEGYVEDTIDAIGIGLWDVWERDHKKPLSLD